MSVATQSIDGAQIVHADASVSMDDGSRVDRMRAHNAKMDTAHMFGLREVGAPPPIAVESESAHEKNDLSVESMDEEDDDLGNDDDLSPLGEEASEAMHSLDESEERAAAREERRRMLGDRSIDSCESDEDERLRKKALELSSSDDDMDDDDDDDALVRTEAKVDGDVSSDEEDGSHLDDEAAIRADAGDEIVSDDVDNMTASEHARLRASMRTPDAAPRRPVSEHKHLWQKLFGERISSRLLRRIYGRGAGAGSVDETRMHTVLNLYAFSLIEYIDPCTAKDSIEASQRYMRRTAELQREHAASGNKGAAPRPEEHAVTPLDKEGGGGGTPSVLGHVITNRDVALAFSAAQRAAEQTMRVVGLKQAKSNDFTRVRSTHYHALATHTMTHAAFTLNGRYLTVGDEMRRLGVRCVLSGELVRPGDRVYRMLVPTAANCDRMRSYTVADAYYAHGVIDAATLAMFEPKSGVEVECGRNSVARVMFVHASLYPRKEGDGDFVYGVYDWKKQPHSMFESGGSASVSASPAPSVEHALMNGGGGEPAHKRARTAEAATGGFVNGRVLVACERKQHDRGNVDFVLHAYDPRHAKLNVARAMSAAHLVFTPDAHWVYVANLRARALDGRDDYDALVRWRTADMRYKCMADIRSKEAVPRSRNEWVRFFVELCANDGSLSVDDVEHIAEHVVDAERDRMLAMIEKQRPTSAFTELLSVLMRWFSPDDTPLTKVRGPDAVLTAATTAAPSGIDLASKQYAASMWSASALASSAAEREHADRTHFSVAQRSALPGMLVGVQLHDNELPLNVRTVAALPHVAVFLYRTISAFVYRIVGTFSPSGQLDEETTRQSNEKARAILRSMNKSFRPLFYTRADDEQEEHAEKFAKYKGFILPIFNAMFPCALLRV